MNAPANMNQFIQGPCRCQAFAIQCETQEESKVQHPRWLDIATFSHERFGAIPLRSAHGSYRDRPAIQPGNRERRSPRSIALPEGPLPRLRQFRLRSSRLPARPRAFFPGLLNTRGTTSASHPSDAETQGGSIRVELSIRPLLGLRRHRIRGTRSGRNDG